MTEREKVIRECIEYLKGRPGRNSIRSLKLLLLEELQNNGLVVDKVDFLSRKPSADHPWRKTEVTK